MGVWSTLKQALGLQRPLEVVDGDVPLRLTPGAADALGALPDGHGLHIRSEPVSDELVRWVVDAGPLQGPPPPPWEGLPLTANDADEARCRGLQLDCQGGAWAMSLHLEVRARDTPNPDGRLYLFSRHLVDGDDPLFFATDGDHIQVPALVDEILSLPGVKTVLLRGNTASVVRESGVAWDAIDRGTDAAVRQWFLLGGRELKSAEVRQLHDPLAQKVLSVLEATVLPAIHKDGGDLELLGVDRGVVRVKMQGACAGCPSSTATLHHGIEATLRKAFPGEIERVEAV